MRRDQQIRVNELLLQREELFLRIHAAETEAARILGEPWPFVRPALPSDRRSKKKPASSASRAADAAKKPPADALRRLGEGEAAYLVTYRQFGKETTETHVDFAAVATLLAGQTAQIQVLRIETLDASGAPLATILQ